MWGGEVEEQKKSGRHVKNGTGKRKDEIASTEDSELKFLFSSLLFLKREKGKTRFRGGKNFGETCKKLDGKKERRDCIN